MFDKSNRYKKSTDKNVRPTDNSSVMFGLFFRGIFQSEKLFYNLAMG